jgi:hypothetical protein
MVSWYDCMLLNKSWYGKATLQTLDTQSSQTTSRNCFKWCAFTYISLDNWWWCINYLVIQYSTKWNINLIKYDAFSSNHSLFQGITCYSPAKTEENDKYCADMIVWNKVPHEYTIWTTHSEACEKSRVGTAVKVIQLKVLV